MSLPNPETVVTEERLNEFYTELLPYLGGRADSGFTPVGTIIAVMGNSAPTNYLACNGQTVNIADYPELAAYFKAQFGSANKFGGDGTTTFAICDLRGEFLRGTGTNSHANQGNGAAVGTHQDGTVLPIVSTDNNALTLYHNHTSSAWYQHTENADKTVKPTSGGKMVVNGTGTYNTTPTAVQIETSRPTNTSVLYCIATKNIYLNPSLDYSTDEKVVGTWIDGKPIYQKTIVPNSTTTLPNKDVISIPIGLPIGTVDTLVNMYGMIKENGSGGQWKTLPHVQDNNSAMNASIQLYDHPNDGTIFQILCRDGNVSTYVLKHITLLYTKTTD